MGILRLFDKGATGWIVLDWLGVLTMIGSGLATFGAIFKSLPFPLDLIVALASVAIVVLLFLIVGGIIGRLHQWVRPLTNADGITFSAAFRDLIESRTKLFSYYDSKYANFAGRPDDAPTSLRDLLQSLPIILPKSKERMDNFWDRLKREGDSPTKTLLSFCEQFYPHDAAGALDSVADNLRMVHAKFWNEWYLDSIFWNTFTHKEVIRGATANWEQIKLLYFLQLAQDAQKRKMASAAKSGLHDLADRIAKAYDNHGNERWLAASISALKRLAS